MLASVEKVGAVSRYAVLPLGDVAGVVTDAPADAPVVQELVAGGVDGPSTGR